MSDNKDEMSGGWLAREIARTEALIRDIPGGQDAVDQARVRAEDDNRDEAEASRRYNEAAPSTPPSTPQGEPMPTNDLPDAVVRALQNALAGEQPFYAGSGDCDTIRTFLTAHGVPDDNHGSMM